VRRLKVHDIIHRNVYNVLMTLTSLKTTAQRYFPTLHIHISFP